jgi:hypothetical protein
MMKGPDTIEHERHEVHLNAPKGPEMTLPVSVARGIPDRQAAERTGSLLRVPITLNEAEQIDQPLFPAPRRYIDKMIEDRRKNRPQKLD